MQTRQSLQQPKDTSTLSRTHTPASQQAPELLSKPTHPTALIQRAVADPRSLTRAGAIQLQRTMGNRAVGRLVNSGRKINPRGAGQRPDEQGKENTTGLPDRLKAGIESLSGMAMDDVRVHYNSPKPAQLQALAYTQGSDIHVAAGQEQHLPHEAWHVVQQAQDRVKPTMQLKDGVSVNDNERLEHEADVMGQQAAQPGWTKSWVNSSKSPGALQGKSSLTSFAYTRPDQRLSRSHLLATVQRVKIKGEPKGDIFLAVNVGGPYDETLKIIKSLGDENFETLDKLKERVQAMLPASSPTPSTQTKEEPSGVESSSWRSKTSSPSKSATSTPKALQAWGDLGEIEVDGTTYQIQSHKHARTEEGFHIKFDSGTKYVNIFFTQTGGMKEERPKVTDRVSRSLGCSKTKAKEVVTRAVALASKFKEAVATSTETV